MPEDNIPKHIIEARALATNLSSLPLLEQNNYITELIKCLKTERSAKIELYKAHLQKLAMAEDDLRVSIINLCN